MSVPYRIKREGGRDGWVCPDCLLIMAFETARICVRCGCLITDLGRAKEITEEEHDAMWAKYHGEGDAQ